MKKTILLLTVLSASASVQAKVMYLGIGNDEFADDVTTALNKIQPCFGPADSGETHTQQDGPDIIAQLNDAKTSCQPGDIFIFHYSGHGGFQASGTETDGEQGIIGTSPDQGATFPNPATDD